MNYKKLITGILLSLTIIRSSFAMHDASSSSSSSSSSPSSSRPSTSQPEVDLQRIFANDRVVVEHAQLANTIEYHNHTYEEKNTWKSYGRNIANGATHSIGSHLGSDLYSLVKNRIFSAKQKQTNQNDNDDLSTIIALQQMLDQEAEQLKNMSEVIESLENDPIRADACKKMKNQLTVLSLQHMEKRMHLAGYGQQKKPTTATAPVYQSKLAEQKQEQQTPPATGTTIA